MKRLSKETIGRILIDLHSAWTNKSNAVEVTPAARSFLLDAQPEERRAAAQDAMIFRLDFIREGHPERFIPKMHAGTVHDLTLRAIDSMSRGEAPEVAADLMRKALAASGSGRAFDAVELNWFYAIALLRDSANPANRKRLAAAADLKRFEGAFTHVGFRGLCELGALRDARPELERLVTVMDNSARIFPPLPAAFIRIAAKNAGCRTKLEPTTKRLEALGYGVLALEAANQGGTVADKRMLEQLSERLGMKPILPFHQETAEWERVLDRIIVWESTRSLPKKRQAEGAQERISYLVNRSERTLEIRRQKSRGGAWGKPEAVTLSAFRKGLDCMNARDKEIAATLSGPSMRRLAFPWPDVLKHLAGCEAVFEPGDPERRIDVRIEPLQISVSRTQTNFQVTSNFPDDTPLELGRAVIGAGPKDAGDIRIIELSPDDRRLTENFRSVKRFPKAAEEKLSACLGLVARTTPVMSDLIKSSSALEERKSDARITFRFTEEDDAQTPIHVSAAVRPFAESPITFEPGEGRSSIVASTAAGPVQVIRDRVAEKLNLTALTTRLETEGLCLSDRNEWRLTLPECLRFLEILRQEPEKALVEWPRGMKFAVSRPPISADALTLDVGRVGQWLEIEGGAKLDRKLMIPIADLLARLRESEDGFIRLSDTEFVAVTKELRHALSALDGLGKASKKGLKISAFNAESVEAFEDAGVAVSPDEATRTLVARMRTAESLSPDVPKGLAAELRDYQLEGFRWLSRLASWGAGALLADDMGLGKTVQTIAFLLSRADQGPALIVTPASVLLNWRDELARFAPNLAVTVLNSADRSAAVTAAGPGDVLLVTYDVLATDSETIAARSRATAVLDEAHAIKNRETKMSKAVMRLEADARVLLTGTPLQNHLSEIWNLMEFANSGLLGSLQDFAERFVIPIERNRDPGCQRLLKRILSPFILRRTKAEVAGELPGKTEITLRVELSAEERALYESLRESAQKRLDEKEINPIEVLGELTKLRQAACHPALIDPKLPIESSKTRAFLELAEELVSGGHRALVFSQFTSHLALIRRELDARGVEHLYLDGSMSSSERIRLVDAFQKGSMPLFLISLKAGGTGLNLTAADYVIHLDPWWNPAVEDQASDRTYRIGQTRPVTIYRLIAGDTIEEKILRLHKTKKSLADALLEGSDMSARLSREEIMALLSEA